MTKTLPNIIVRINQKTNYVVVLCPLGHLITAHKLDRDYAGSMLEADLGSYQAGHEVHWHRLAATCCGAGHKASTHQEQVA